MRRGYKYRLYPNPEQARFLERHFGACRYVYNHFLELRQTVYKERGESINGFACKRLLVPLKREHSWLKEINSQSLQQSVLDLESAYRRFFQKLGGYPQFKSKRSLQSFAVPQNFSIEEGKLHIPKLKSGIKVKVHREMVGVLKLATISRTQTGKYYVSVNCEFEPQVLPVVDRTEGVDLGLIHFAVLSGGEKIEHPKVLKQSERRLKRLESKGVV